MASFNKVILAGNLVENPELKQTPSGVPVTSFRIAVSRRFKNSNGETEADFFNIVCWRNTAEFVKKYFGKGNSILVCGSLQSRSYTGSNNQKRYVVEVVADEVTFMEKKSDNSATTETPTAPYNNDMQFEAMTTDDDLPF